MQAIKTFANLSAADFSHADIALQPFEELKSLNLPLLDAA